MRLVLLAFTLSAAMFGQTIPGRYVLELSGEPAAAHLTARSAAFAARRAGVRAAQADARKAVAAHGGTVIAALDTVFNGLIVTIPAERAAELMQVPGAVKVHPVRRVRKSLDHALPLHKVIDAWNLLPLGENGAGAGIKVAILDTGIDVNHPGFSDPLPALDGFPKVLTDTDRAFTSAKIIVAKNYTSLYATGSDSDADDHDGHGTGTAMAAAGGTTPSPYGTLTGVAPKAYIGNYKVLGPNGGTSDVIAKAIDDAVADGMDVINLSLGGYVASYSDIDPGEVGMAALSRAAQAGVIVTVSAGNEGPGAGTIADFASSPDAITLGAIHNDRALAYGITADGGAAYMAYSGGGANPGQIVSGALFDVTQVDPTGLACSALPAGAAAGQIVLIGRGTCTFAVKLTNAQAAGAAAAIVYNNPGGTAFSTGSVTVGTATLPALFLNQADGADLKSRAAANSGLQVALDFSGATPFAARTDVSDFSSRGPSVGSALKPDLVAVGEEIVTAAQRNYSDGELYSADGFLDLAGTSFSAPLTAGAAAVLKGARPGLTGPQYRSLLINSASTATAAEGRNATVSQAGAGVLNLAAAMTGTISAQPASLNLGTGATLAASLPLNLTNLGTAADTFTLRVVPAADGMPAPSLSNATLSVDAGATQQVTLALNADGLAAGEYTGYIEASAANSGTVVRIPYWFAAPGSTPAGVSVLYQDWHDSPQSTSTAAVVFRVVDAAGLPYSGTTTPRVTGASGSVRAYRAGSIPGTYAVDVRTGTTSMTVNIVVDGITETVTIPVY